MNPDIKKLPQHIAIIMDGNGRWASQKGLPRIEGHRRGSEVVEGMVTLCREIGVRYLTLYAFSMENWVRPKDEIGALMFLLKLAEPDCRGQPRGPAADDQDIDIKSFTRHKNKPRNARNSRKDFNRTSRFS